MEIKSNKEPLICVIFRNNSANGKNSAPIMIQCMKNEKVSTLIEKYRNKTNDRDLTEKFEFNAKTLILNYLYLKLVLLMVHIYLLLKQKGLMVPIKLKIIKYK